MAGKQEIHEQKKLLHYHGRRRRKPLLADEPDKSPKTISNTFNPMFSPRQKHLCDAPEMEIPDAGRVYVYDLTLTGLCICVTAVGTKTWYLYRKVNGRPVRLKIGRYPEIAPELARQLATEAAGRMAGGQDVQAERVSKRKAETTWEQVFLRFLEEHAKLHKKSWSTDESNDRLYLADWKHRTLTSISRADVAAKHREIGEKTPIAANRVLSLISKVFAFSELNGIWGGSNPAKGIRRFHETQRDRFIQPDEMPRRQSLT